MNTILRNEQNRNKPYLDLIRIVAIFFVIYNHTPGFYFLPYGDCGNAGYWGLLILNQVVKMAVPLFLMVTGALLLHKEEDIKSLLNRRVMRFAIAIIVICMIQYTFHLLWTDNNGKLHVFFTQLLNGMGGCQKFHANWFLYAYTGILLMLPFLRAIAKNLPDKFFLYLLGIQIIFCCVIPLVWMRITGDYVGYSAFVSWLPFHPQGKFHPYSAGYVAFYVLMGYYLEHRVSWTAWQQNKSKYVLTAIACLVLGAVCMWDADYCQGKKILHQSVIYLTAFLPIPCAVAYMIMKSTCYDRVFHPLVGKVIASLGGAVFTVMCIENLFRVKWEGIYSDLLPEINRVPAAIIFTAAIWGAAILVGLIIKRIPFINRIF